MKSSAFDYLDRSMDYATYTQLFSMRTNAFSENMTDNEKEMLAYYQLNWARSSRVEKVYQPSVHALHVLNSMNSKHVWIVITEGWCGDSAQSLPVIAALSKASQGNIELRIISRDAYLELLEQYRTNGSMSIPKLIACDDEGEELWTWGPRPANAQKLFDEMRANNSEKQEIYKVIHGFYAKDKGQSIETEIIHQCV